MTEALETQSGSAKYREDLHDLLTFWKGHCTYNVVLEETPAEIRRVIPTEQWKTQPVPASPIIRMAGAYVDYDRLLRGGICGLEEEVRTARAAAQREGRDVVIYDCMLGALDLLRDCCRYYRDQAQQLSREAKTPRRAKEMSDLAKAPGADHPPSAGEPARGDAAGLAVLHAGPADRIRRMDEYLGDFTVTISTAASSPRQRR